MISALSNLRFTSSLQKKKLWALLQRILQPKSRKKNTLKWNFIAQTCDHHRHLIKQKILIHEQGSDGLQRLLTTACVSVCMCVGCLSFYTFFFFPLPGTHFDIIAVPVMLFKATSWVRQLLTPLHTHTHTLFIQPHTKQAHLPYTHTHFHVSFVPLFTGTPQRNSQGLWFRWRPFTHTH